MFYKLVNVQGHSVQDAWINLQIELEAFTTAYILKSKTFVLESRKETVIQFNLAEVLSFRSKVCYFEPGNSILEQSLFNFRKQLHFSLPTQY